jgi:hypothetical protein
VKATLLVLVVTVAALVASGHASARQLCTPSSTGTSRSFCGPAKATLKVGGKTYKFKSGSCAILAGNFTLNLGKESFAGKPKSLYFGLVVYGKKPGKYTHTIVSWQFPGKLGSNKSSTVRLAKKGVKSGTFTGKTRDDGSKDSGSFSCG